MQKLFHWHSQYLKSYSSGDIVAMGETVEQARETARKGFEPHYADRYAWMYSSLADMLIDPDHQEDLDKARALFEADIAKEPQELPGFIFISGSE